MTNISSDSLVLELTNLVLPQGGYVSTPELDLHATSFTIATKVFLDSTANRNILLGNWSNNQRAWQLLFAVNAGGNLAINLRKDLPTNGSDPTQDLVALVGNVPITAKEWHHVAITFDRGSDYVSPTATLYVDGKVAGTVSPEIKPDPRVHNPYTLKPSPNAYLIGHKEDGTGKDEWFSGQLADFRIYTAALTASDIDQINQHNPLVAHADSAAAPSAPSPALNPVVNPVVQDNGQTAALPASSASSLPETPTNNKSNSNNLFDPVTPLFGRHLLHSWLVLSIHSAASAYLACVACSCFYSFYNPIKPPKS